MSRNVKIKLAALATAALTTVGTLGMTASVATDAAPKGPQYGTKSWCC